MEELIQQLSAELNCPASYVQNVVTLIDEGNTIPFIARYRKELHGGMDDTALRTLADRLAYLRNLAQRRDEITRSIAAQEKLTDELFSAIQAAKTLAELEDLYRPYKPKRRTRATIARERACSPSPSCFCAGARPARAGGAGCGICRPGEGRERRRGRAGRRLGHRRRDDLRRRRDPQDPAPAHAAAVRRWLDRCRGQGGGRRGLSPLF